MARPIRVCLGLGEIAGYYGNLRRGFRQIGVECTFLNLGEHAFAYAEDDPPWLLVRLRSVGRRMIRARDRGQVRSLLLWRLTYRVLKLLLFGWAVVRHDAFIFGYRSTFFRFRELPLLRRLGKRVIYVFHGSDSRPPYLDGSTMAADSGRSIEDCIAFARETKEALRSLSRHADVLVCAGTHAHFLEREFVQGLAIGLPSPGPPVERSRAAGSAEWSRPPARPRPDEPVRLLHAPSHPEVKGTGLVRAAVERLRQRGYAIDLVEVVGQPNSVVMEEMAACDLVVDQAYSDTPLAGFATEAAAFGKPAVVGGYSGEEIRRTNPADWIPPSELVHPDQLEAAIERLVADPAYRRELGARARHFVETRWSQRQVAERYLRLIRDDIPAEWLRDPRDVAYLQGGGLSEERARALVRAVVEAGGIAALQLDDKPELLRALLAFAGCAPRGSDPDRDARVPC